MLQPKRTKFRKAHKGRIKGNAKGGTALNFGAYGLKALEPERITARQIEAARRAITRAMKRAGRVWIRIFPDVPVSRKPAEVRMGSGKGAPEFWVVPGQAGPHHVRDRRRGAGAGARGADARRRQAADQDQVRHPHRGCVRAWRSKPSRSISGPRPRTSCPTLLLNLRREQFNLRFQRATGQLEGVGRVRTVRRDIARVKTIQAEQKRSAATS